MERESYENPEMATLMNTYLVNVKVDREERPDVDKIYMMAVQSMTGSGGWPLNAFLTPELKPFFGGTYFPPAAKWGHPGWGDIVTQIGKSWKDPEERKKMLETGSHITDALKQYASSADLSAEALAKAEGKPEWLDQGFKAFKSAYDASRGGFGGAPKFPMPVNHFFLLRYGARVKNREANDMTLHTLREMSKGGICDSIGGGFARYSTDANWHIPHFEKMLYDNAQLTANYLEAYQLSKDPEFARVARETLDYIARDMTSPDGGFYSAEDADSLPSKDAKEKVEGAFYVWERKEIIDHLGPKAGPAFCFRYGVRDTGNAAQDPHGEFKNKNILYAAHSIPETAREFKLSEDETVKQFEGAKKVLFEVRTKRPRPHLDDKILSAWNGLMVSAYAKAYQVLGEEKDLKAAQKAAQFIRNNLYDSGKKLLYRNWREGQHGAPGISDDYAFTAQGLLDLYEADFDPAWLEWAIELQDAMNNRFYDRDHGGFYMTAVDQDPHLLVRIKEDQDNVEPASSSVAALNLLRLWQFTGHEKYKDIATKTLQAFGGTLKESPRAMPYMLAALDFSLTAPRQVVIVGKDGAPDTNALLKVLHNHYSPVKVVMLGGQTGLSKASSYMRDMRPLDGKATVYLCENHVCKKPTNDPKVFEKQLMR